MRSASVPVLPQIARSRLGIAAVNQIGSVLFMISAIAAFTRPETGEAERGHCQLGHPHRCALLRHRRGDAGVRSADCGGQRAIRVRARRLEALSG